MIIDGRSLAPRAVLRPNVCIVGAGPAGLALAAHLADSQLEVLIIDSGAQKPDQRTQALGDLVPTGTDFEPGKDSRRRAVGGSAHLWNTFIQGNQPSARFLPLDEVDFEERECLPHSGWPFGRADLDPHYARAARLVGIRQYPIASNEVRGRSPLRIDPTYITTTIEHFGMADVFTSVLPDALGRKSNITFVLATTVTRLGAASNGAHISRVHARTLAGNELTVEAETFVLAAGGIENPRLLLASNDVVTTGIGNSHDLVGRFFMDHHRINGGVLVPFQKLLFKALSLYDLRAFEGNWIMGKLTPAQGAMRRGDLLNCSTLLWPRASARLDGAVDALHELSGLRHGRVPPELTQKLLSVARGLPYLAGTGLRLMAYQHTMHPNVARGGWSRLPANDRRFEVVDMVHQVEQAPDPNNRVTLGEQRDELGMPLARVSSQWSEVDLNSLRRNRRLLAEQLERAGIGRVIDPTADGPPSLHQLGGMHHHMGTTRMHVDPARGVVDSNLRVHGVDNLFVAGSSVFPTAGYANPTLTLLALSIRLADHLRGRTLGAPAAAAFEHVG